MVNASFLLGAQQITRPDWASALLVIAAVANVPIFILALFLLQTKFRPQMQEDSYYAQYLQSERQFNVVPKATTAEVVENEIVQTAEKIVKSLGPTVKGKEKPVAEILRESQNDLMLAKHSGSRTLAELYVSPHTWTEIVNLWSQDESFIRDVEGLLEDGLIEKKYKGYKNCKLTDLGNLIAKLAEERGLLFSQRKNIIWERDH